MRKFLTVQVLFIALFALSSQATAQQLQDSCEEASAIVADTQIVAQQNSEPYFNHAGKDEIHPMQTNRMPAFVFYIMVFQLALLAYLRRAFPKSLEEMTRALTNLTMAQQLYREQELTMPVSAIFYNINFVFSGGIFLFLLNGHFSWTDIPTSFVTMLFFLWGVIVLYSLKYGSMKFMAIIFPFGNEVNHYNFNFFLAQKIIGILLIPINLFIAYSPESFQAALIVVALILLALFIIGIGLKGLEISRNLLQHDALHYFIYIFALEIAPVCILVKVVVEWLS
ncbi:MAG: DUF4271 domain-containing protein [Chitinophagales bacterium]|nr:DUF4271 domain-containing protein [Chitinophagales bacterium]